MDDRRSYTSSATGSDYYAAYAAPSRSSSIYDDDNNVPLDDNESRYDHSSPPYRYSQSSQHHHDHQPYHLHQPHPSPEHHRYSAASSNHSASTSSRISLARSSVPSFAAFRSRASSIPFAAPSALRQTPAGGAAAPPSRHASSASLSAATLSSPRLVSPRARPFSLDSRLPQPLSGPVNAVLARVDEHPTPRLENRSSSGSHRSPSSHTHASSIDSRIVSSETNPSPYSPKRSSSIPIHTRYASEDSISHAPKPTLALQSPSERSSQTLMGGTQEAPPPLTLHLDGVQRTLTNESLTVSESGEQARPKSPGGRLGNFFGWKTSPSPSPSPRANSEATSERSMSPVPSPSPQVDKPLPPVEPPSPHPATAPSLVIPPTRKGSSEYIDNPQAPILAGSPENLTHVKELERELAQVSAELAASIRREMDLEDDLDRIRMENPSVAPSDSGRRGSDYFSDSGTSSVRFPITDYDSKFEQLERSLRKVEQEKANLKLDMASRLQAELSRRRDLEQMVQTYEVQLKKSIDDHGERSDMEGRVEVLVSTLEDTRRLLSQERQAKGSFEDLYTATREELERHMNESDNLRDEVVPQLKARVEGLESEVAEKEALTYENTRMQQELNSLHERLGGRYSSIAEDGTSRGIARSGSISRHGKRGGSLTRSGSVRDGANSVPLPLTAESMKEIEDQRDALHKALKLLISRHDKQRKDHQRAIKRLTSSRGATETSLPAARSPYHKEVSFLKDEVTTLRKRTEDALESKYQYERNLSGIKMDLDRAEQETRDLRNLLQQNDILAVSPNGAQTFDDAKRRGSGDNLGISISNAEEQRDAARKSAAEYRQKAQSAKGGNAAKLNECAQRMDSLAKQLEEQVQSNITLRERLTQAVAQGENEQRESSAKINDMQKRLADLEDSVIATQQHSENTLHAHETDVRKIEEASSPALQRLTLAVPASPALLRSPKISSRNKRSDASLLESSRAHLLERKVRGLETLLREADQDMEGVLQRVHRSQREVATLQTERDASMAQMQKLQGLITAEQKKAAAL